MGLNKPSGNMYPWAYTWSPMGGECPHRCAPCYVSQKIAPMIKRTSGNDKYYGEPRLIEKEMNTSLHIPEGDREDKVIFVESCGDLFAMVDGVGLTDYDIKRVLAKCNRNPENRYLLQTRNVSRMKNFVNEFPPRVLLGTTIDSDRQMYASCAPPPRIRKHHIQELREMGFPVMVSIEPVCEFNMRVMVEWLRDIQPEFVSIGADSQGALEELDVPEPSYGKVMQLRALIAPLTEVRLKSNLDRLKEEAG